MTISAGSFLNSRWIKINSTWDVWPDILSSTTLADIEKLRERSIIRVGDSWYLQIYEVVSGLNKLRRQRVKIRHNYALEKRWRSSLMAAVERDIARDAMGTIKLSPTERKSLEDLNRQIESRLQEIDSVSSQLSPRETFAYAGGLVEINTLDRYLRSLREAVNQPLIQAFAPGFDNYLEKVVQELGALVSLEVRHHRFWCQYHLRRAAEMVREGQQERCRYHIQNAINRLVLAIENLKGWTASLTQEEVRYVISA